MKKRKKKENINDGIIYDGDSENNPDQLQL